MTSIDLLKIGFAGIQFVTSAGLMLWILTKVFELKTNIGEMNEKFTHQLSDHAEKISGIVTKERHEAILAQRRIDVHDGFASQLSEQPFNSRQVVDGKRHPPRVAKPLGRILIESGHENSE